jgi:hypothetical protein
MLEFLTRTQRRTQLLGVVTAFAAWTIFWLLSPPVYSQMAVPCIAPCRGASSYYRYSPYCAVDPVCVTPFLGGRQPYAYAPWSGIAYLDLRSLASGNGLRSLAIPNYLLFVAIAVASIYAAARFVRIPRFRSCLLAAIGCWFALELLRWLVVLAEYDDSVVRRWPLTVGGAILLAIPVCLALRAAVARRTPGSI